MILLDGALFLAEVVLVIYCVLSVITTPGDQVKHLPKPVWLLVVVLLPLLGGLSWLMFGRQAGARTPGGPVGSGGSAPGPGRQRRVPAPPPDDDEDFLRSLRERADEQRRQAERHRREIEERRRREGGTSPEA